MTSQDDNTDASNAKPKAPSKPKLGQPSASEESASKYPNMGLCQQIHKLVAKAEGATDGTLQTEVLTRIREELENPSLYESVELMLGVDTGIWSAADLASKKEAHQKTAEELEQKVEDAKESAGDMEVMDARVELARFAAKSLTENEALEAYKKLLDLPKISSGKKIDAVMESARVSSFYGNTKKASEFTDSVSIELPCRGKVPREHGVCLALHRVRLGTTLAESSRNESNRFRDALEGRRREPVSRARDHPRTDKNAH